MLVQDHLICNSPRHEVTKIGVLQIGRSSVCRPSELTGSVEESCVTNLSIFLYLGLLLTETLVTCVFSNIIFHVLPNGGKTSDSLLFVMPFSISQV